MHEYVECKNQDTHSKRQRSALPIPPQSGQKNISRLGTRTTYCLLQGRSAFHCFEDAATEAQCWRLLRVTTERQPEVKPADPQKFWHQYEVLP